MHKKLKIQGFFTNPEIGQNLTLKLDENHKIVCFIDDSVEALEFSDLKQILIDVGADDDDIEGVGNLFEFYDLWRLANY